MRDEPPAVPTGFWRGVGPNNNAFAIESFTDELAKKASKDPVAFRRNMLDKPFAGGLAFNAPSGTIYSPNVGK